MTEDESVTFQVFRRTARGLRRLQADDLRAQDYFIVVSPDTYAAMLVEAREALPSRPIFPDSAGRDRLGGVPIVPDRTLRDLDRIEVRLRREVIV